MKRCIFGTPNYLDVDLNTPNVVINTRLGSGSWSANSPISNLKTEDINDTAVSSDTAVTSTRVDFNLGTTRGIKLTAIPRHNISQYGKVRLRYMNAPQFSGCTVYANAPQGASSVSFLASAQGAVINAGDSFTINNSDDSYSATSSVTIPANGNASIPITPSLLSAVTAGQLIQCISGDLSSTVYDTGETEVWGEVYEYGQLNYGDPGWYDLRYTAEQAVDIKMPYFDIADSRIIAQYGRIDINDTANSDGYISLSRLIVSAAYQPTLNPVYGIQTGWKSNSVKTKSNVKNFINIQEPYRFMDLQILDISKNEGLQNDFDLKRQLDIKGQIFFILDPDDIINRHRTSFLCTMEQLDAIAFPYFDASNTAWHLEEVIA